MFPDIVFLIFFAKYEAEDRRVKLIHQDPKSSKELKEKYDPDLRRHVTTKSKVVSVLSLKLIRKSLSFFSKQHFYHKILYILERPRKFGNFRKF